MTSQRSNCIKTNHFRLLLIPCPGGPAPQPQGRGCNGAGAGASADRGAIPRSFRVVRRIQSGLSRVESPLLQPCLLESGLWGQFKPEPQPRHICAPSPEAERGPEKGSREEESRAIHTDFPRESSGGGKRAGVQGVSPLQDKRAREGGGKERSGGHSCFQQPLERGLSQE